MPSRTNNPKHLNAFLLFSWLEDMPLVIGSSLSSKKGWNHLVSISVVPTVINKAVADGAVSYFVDHFVTARVSKLFYGVSCGIRYDAGNPEHRLRSGQIYVDAAGYKCLPDCISVILPQGHPSIRDD